MPAPAWTVAIPSLHVGGTDDDAGVEVAVGGEIAHRAAVAAAAFTFGGGNQLHGADLRRAAEGAHIHAGAIGVEGRRDPDAIRLLHGRPDASRRSSGQPWLNQRHSGCPGCRCAPPVITRQVHQHQVFGKLFMIGAHFQLDAAVEVAIQRAVGAAAAWPGAGDGVDLNLTADGIILQRAFGEAPNRVKSLSCIKNMYGLGLLFFSTS